MRFYQAEALAARTWQHPITGKPARFGLSTIERWYARARREGRDPVGVLRGSPDRAALRFAFTRTERRTQRVSDGTIVLEA